MLLAGHVDFPVKRSINPAAIFIRVDLPAPFSPINAWISPATQIEIDLSQNRSSAQNSWIFPASAEPIDSVLRSVRLGQP